MLHDGVGGNVVQHVADGELQLHAFASCAIVDREGVGVVCFWGQTMAMAVVEREEEKEELRAVLNTELSAEKDPVGS